jgi:hypothetical protein
MIRAKICGQRLPLGKPLKSDQGALPVLILEYVARAGGLLALVGGLITMMTNQR